jgi:hypothetical protein
VLVALLTFSASGVSTLVIVEPCTSYEQPGHDDGTCPPTCVTCGCCAQAVEPAILVAATTIESPVAEITPIIPRPLKTTSRDILHVPKPRFA